jgi:hypothetical protein
MKTMLAIASSKSGRIRKHVEFKAAKHTIIAATSVTKPTPSGSLVASPAATPNLTGTTSSLPKPCNSPIDFQASECRATLIKAAVINPHAASRETRCCLRAGAERVQTPPRSTNLCN